MKLFEQTLIPLLTLMSCLKLTFCEVSFLSTNKPSKFLTKPSVSFLQEAESSKSDAEELRRKFLETLNKNLMDSSNIPQTIHNNIQDAMRFSEARSSSSLQTGANPAPTEKELNKSQVFQKDLRDKLQKGRVFYVAPDERQKSNFEVKADLDPFVGYLGYLRDTSLKAFEVVEKKELTEFNKKSAGSGAAISSASASGGSPPPPGGPASIARH